MKKSFSLMLAVVCFLIGGACAGEEEPKRHLFYFHGRIVEDGLPAISPQFGAYEYLEIKDALQRDDIILHAKQRASNADIKIEADEAITQIRVLLDAGVSSDRITIVGASKGSQIAALVSHGVADPETKLIILAGCWPAMVRTLIEDEIHLYGDVLEIRDVEDRGLEPGCGEAVAASPHVISHKEIVTKLRVSHGLIYRPYKEWVTPTLDWVLASGN